jgi:hypothetical protein
MKLTESSSSTENLTRSSARLGTRVMSLAISAYSFPPLGALDRPEQQGEVLEAHEHLVLVVHLI